MVIGSGDVDMADREGLVVARGSDGKRGDVAEQLREQAGAVGREMLNDEDRGGDVRWDLGEDGVERF
jgi:hypothetical protein